MSEKIGRYTEDEILKHLTEGEGRGFLGRSMYDAIFDKIHALITKKDQLQQENQKYKEVIKEIIEYLQSKKFEENFPYVVNECQVRGTILNIVVERIMTEDFNELLDILKGVE